MQEWIESSNGMESRGNGQWLVVGRLRPGIAAAQAQAQLNTVAQQLEKEYPGNDQGMALRLTPPGLVDPNLRSAVLAFTGALMLTVVLVLMIACSNLASLLLARAAQRRKEIAVRMAIGATRFRLTRQLLTESLMLSVIGAAFGLLLGTFLMRLAQASLPSTDFALTLDLRLDWRVLFFVPSLALLTGIGFGLVPAVYASRPDVVSTLKEDALGGGRKSRLRSVLVVLQVALSFVLLITAGLTVRSLSHTEGLGPGFDPSHLSAPEGVIQTQLHPDRAYHADLSDGRIGSPAGRGVVHGQVPEALFLGLWDGGDLVRFDPAGARANLSPGVVGGRVGRVGLGGLPS
jgi:hypothetical protein